MKKITGLIAILGLLLACSNSLVAQMVIESDILGLDNDAYTINNDDGMMLDSGYMSDDMDFDVAPMTVGVSYDVGDEVGRDNMREGYDRVQSNIENREGMNRGMNRGMEGGARGMSGHGGRR